MMASLLLQKRGYLQLGVIFQGFWTRKLPLNNPVQLCLFFLFPHLTIPILLISILNAE